MKEVSNKIVSIITVSCGVRDHLKESLDSLRRQTYALAEMQQFSYRKKLEENHPPTRRRRFLRLFHLVGGAGGIWFYNSTKFKEITKLKIPFIDTGTWGNLSQSLIFKNNDRDAEKNLKPDR